MTDFSQYIECHYWDGKHPHIAGRRIRVAWIVEQVQERGIPIPTLAKQIRLSEEVIQIALAYYAEHQAEIDASEQDADSDEFRQRLYQH
jgi:uncharacterized protein (DUF433 family)